MTAELQIALAAIAFFAGIGITAIGPGGIFLTIALYTLTSLSSHEVAGTASALMVATGLLGSAIYIRSGELRERGSWRVALLLSAASIAGGLAGSWLNAFLSRTLFGLLLGVLAVGVGLLIVYRQRYGLGARFELDPRSLGGALALLALGLGVGISGGLLGVGGPVLAVPALVVLGIPILSAVAVAQVQSVFIAAFATAGYVLQDVVLWSLAVLLGVPLLLGVVTGWRVAHRVEADRLELVLGIALIAIGPYLAL